MGEGYFLQNALKIKVICVCVINGDYRGGGS